MELDEQLNIVDGSTKLNVEHIVALKRSGNITIDRPKISSFVGFSLHKRKERCIRITLGIKIGYPLLINF